MRTYTKPRPGYCASCEAPITGRPVHRMSSTYCCIGCAMGDPCVCTYEADMAEDGVDHLGLPFSVPVEQASPARDMPTEVSPSIDAGRATERVPSHGIAVAAGHQRAD